MLKKRGHPATKLQFIAYACYVFIFYCVLTMECAIGLTVGGALEMQLLLLLLLLLTTGDG